MLSLRPVVGVQKRKVGGVDRSLDVLQVVAVDAIVAGLAGAVLPHEALVARQERLPFRWPHVGEDDASQLFARVGGMPNTLKEGAPLRFCWLLQAPSMDVIEPAVKWAADATILY